MEGLVLPDFQFTERNGEPFSRSDAEGKIVVLNFMFTTCKDVCPAAFSVMHQIYPEFQPLKDEVQFITVSVDPKNDTLEQLSKKAKELGIKDQQWAFLREPDIEKVKEFARALRMPDDFPLGHSPKFVLIDKTGQVRDFYDYRNPESIKVMKEKILQLVREGAEQ